MSLPITFSESARVVNPSLHFAYNFDTVNFNNISDGTLPVDQPDKIKTFQIDFTERTSNPNLSISIDRVTSLFTLKNGHLTNTYPAQGSRDKAFVIEGFHLQNVNTEKILVFLPLNKQADTESAFRPLEKSIESKEPSAIDLNTYIPKKDTFSYYKYVDKNGTIFHIVYFEKTTLNYSLLPELPINTYTGVKTTTDVYLSSDSAVRRSAVNSTFEDNIYIDCVPVDVANKPTEKYLSIKKSNYGSYANNFIDILLILSYVILLILVVYGIYWAYLKVSSMLSKPSTSPG